MEPSDFAHHRRQAVMHWLESHGELLARQGYVETTWRQRGSLRIAIYRLCFREQSHRRMIYLGSDARLAEEVRHRLSELQAPRRERRQTAELRARHRANGRRIKAQWNRELRAAGLRLQGYEVRGWRRINRLSRQGFAVPS